MGSRVLEFASYNEYLQTEGWKETRRAAVWAAGGRCQLCGSATRALEVHHVSYDNLGAEGPEDLAVLCDRCHGAYETGLEMIVSKEGDGAHG